MSLFTDSYDQCVDIVVNYLLIRKASTRDISLMTYVAMKAFDVKDYLLARKAYEVSLEVQPDGCFVVEDSELIIGTACFYIYNSFAWIGLVAIVPEYQRRGLGTKLMEVVLNELRLRGIESIGLDSTEAGYRLYKKFGFIDEYRTIMYELPDIDLSSNDIKSLLHKYRIDILDYIPDSIADLDRRVFGGNRTRVLKALIKRGGKLIVINNKGYALIKKDSIGPLIAEDSEIAMALLVKALSMNIKRIIVPEVNREAIKLIESLGGKRVVYCMRMRLGPKIDMKLDKIFAILNYAKG